MVTRPLVVGRYAIYDRIASGGMASVHFGRLTSAMGFTRTVAVKRLHPHLMEDADFLSALLDEARLAARIHHPNVVPTIDVVATDTELLVVMEYVRGESLAQLLAQSLASEERPSWPVVSAIVVGVLQGLHAAHEATSDRGTPLGIVHRDVSPHNILVGIDGVARIIDFGVAKAAGRLQTTREGAVKGKVSYMAPEQLGGDAVTPRTDVYATAVVLWEILAGRRLFQGDDRPSLFGRVLAGVHAPPSRYAPDLPAGVDDLVMKGLRLDPGARFGSAREMAEALGRLVPPSLPTEVGTWVRKVAAEPLARRATLLAAIESDSGAVSAQQVEDTRAGISRIRRASADDAGHEISIVVPARTDGAVPLRSRRLAAVGAAAAALVVVALGLAGMLALRRQAKRESPKAESALATAATALLDAAVVPAAMPATSETAAPPETTAVSNALEAPVAPSASPGPAAPAPPPRRSRAGRAAGPAASSAARDCNPNFYYDSAGQMRFKPECFR